MGGYRELKVWQLGVEISIEVYRATESFPRRENYGLTSQLRRASVSIASNIAEGHARTHTKDLMRFLEIARGSVAEVETQLIIAERLGYIQKAHVRQYSTCSKKKAECSRVCDAHFAPN